MFRISLSAFQTWQRCEMKYKFRYVDKLRPRVKAIAPQLGIVLHSYIEGYYKALHDGHSAPDAHVIGMERLKAWVPIIEVGVQSLVAMKANDDAAQLADLVNKAARISHRYYNARGHEDAERYDVLMVEQPIELALVSDIVSISVIDLLVRDKSDGLLIIVDHKSTGTIPQDLVRLRDPQILLYSVVLNAIGYKPDKILWNYLRTKEPAEPEMTKQHALSRAAIDSTAEAYMEAIQKHGLRPERYGDMLTKLKDKELTAFFPRFEHYIIADARRLMDDYVVEATRARSTRKRWETGAKAIRTITRDCSWCEYNRICETAILGGDEEDVIKMGFTVGTRDPEPEFAA